MPQRLSKGDIAAAPVSCIRTWLLGQHISPAWKLCADPPECDPTAISARLGGLSANLLVENGPIELDFIFGDYLEADGCLRECQENAECFAFDETVDGECAPALNAPVNC